MKKNFFLFGIVILLLIFTYFFQEKRVQTEHLETQRREQVISGEITQLRLPQVVAQKKEGRWWSGETLLSHNTLKQIERKLGQIRKMKDLEGDWNTYFEHPLTFEVNGTLYSLGEMSLDKKGFYLGKGTKAMLVYIEGESQELTQDESEIPSIKRQELVALLSKSAEDLRENQLFRFYPHLPLSRVLIEAEGNLPFELDFEKNTTLPPPISGVSVHDKLKEKFFSLVTQMTIKEEIPFEKSVGFKKLAFIDFYEGDNKKVSWELWLESKTSANAILKDPVNEKSFHLIGGTARGFFIQLQDYWDKKVIPPAKFSSFRRLRTIFIQGEKRAVVTVLNKEPLGFEVEGHKVNDERMNELFMMIFNLGPRDQAERVSLLSKTERQQVLNEEHLRVEVMDQDLLFWRKQEELIVVNLTQGFKAHFNLADENFRVRFEDVLK